MNKKYDCDVLIVGGGVVGLTMACALANTELNVIVLDAEKKVTWHADNPDLRVSAMTLASQGYLQQLGVWDAVVKRRAAPFQRMVVWDGPGGAEIAFDSFSQGWSEMGFIIENSALHAALSEKLRACSNIIIQQASCENLERAEDRHRVTTADGAQYTAPLVIGADGKHSWLRKTVGIGTRNKAYNQMAIVAQVTIENDHENTAWQRFLPTGPVAFLPLTDHKSCSIVWSAEQQMAARLLSMNESDFCHALEDAFEMRLGRVLHTSTRLSFPLEKIHATCYTEPGIVLIGDSAHCIHPMAGQGLNLGILDVKVLSALLIEGLSQQYVVNSPKLLRRYERHRKIENEMMLSLMDGFHNLFCTENNMLAYIRNSGLTMMNKVPLVKNLIMEQFVADSP